MHAVRHAREICKTDIQQHNNSENNTHAEQLTVFQSTLQACSEIIKEHRRIHHTADKRREVVVKIEDTPHEEERDVV